MHKQELLLWNRDSDSDYHLGNTYTYYRIALSQTLLHIEIHYTYYRVFYILYSISYTLPYRRDSCNVN